MNHYHCDVCNAYLKEKNESHTCQGYHLYPYDDHPIEIISIPLDTKDQINYKEKDNK